MINPKNLKKTNHLKHCSKCGQIRFMLRDDINGFCPLCFHRVYFCRENMKKRSLNQTKLNRRVKNG